MPEGWCCYLRAPENFEDVETLQARLKYTAKKSDDATKSLGARHCFSQCEIRCSDFFHTQQFGGRWKKSKSDGSASTNDVAIFVKRNYTLADMGDERRRVPRYSAHVKASIKLPGENTALEVMVEDLCVLGCLLESGPTLEIHQECDFGLTWKGRDFQTPAVVAWRGEQGQVGLEFRNTEPANQEMLREVCADFLMKPLVRLSKDHR